MKKLIFTLFAIIFLVGSRCIVSAQTNVSGGIFSNTTWTLNNSPYIVIDTVVVFPGYTLTIDPGVVVKFADHKRLEIRDATLIAIGTSTDSITFTSNSNTPYSGIWASIYINPNNTSTSNKFSYCNFRYAHNAFEKRDDADSLIINHSSFMFNGTGIGNDIGYGISRVLIDSSSFTYNTCGIGTFVNNVYGTRVFATLNFSDFSHNQQSGVVIGMSNIQNCTFISNQTGIYAQQGPNTIINCIMDSNSVQGLYCEQDYNDLIKNNQIKYNGIGIYDYDYGANIITQNVIENNSIGIKENIDAYYGQDSIYCNKICNNTSYNYYNTTVYNISIPNNYWCTADSASTQALIYDAHVNVNIGLVSFMPLDTSNCYLSGCNIQLTSAVTNATCDTCHNGSASVSVANGFGPFTFTWNTAPIQTNETAIGLAAGTYTVCVVDVNGCTACLSVYVDSTNCAGYSINLHETNSTCINCTDGSAWVLVSGGSAPYSYTWYTAPLQYTDTAVGLLHGTYSVCAVDAYGCVVCDSIVVGTGSCSANFVIYPDTNIMHHYWAVNQASGVPPLTYDWDWGDNTAHDFTANPSHIYANQGSYTICLTITDSVGCQNTFCQSFYLLHPKNLTPVTVNVVSTLTGINSINTSSSSQISIYPNPNDGKFVLSYHLLKETRNITSLQIMDVMGRVVYTTSVKGIEGTQSIDVSDLNNGVYFYQLTNNSEIKEGKFVISK